MGEDHCEFTAENADHFGLDLSRFKKAALLAELHTYLDPRVHLSIRLVALCAPKELSTLFKPTRDVHRLD